MIDRATALASLGVLEEPTRRRVCLHVTERDEPVSRDSAAAALGVARSVVAFHLDKLAAAGLLEIEYTYPELVCAMNLELIRGIVDGAGQSTMSARLEPAEGGCCVSISCS